MLLWRRSCGCVAGAPAIRLRAAVEEGAAVRFLKVSLPGNPQCRLCPVVRFRSHYKIRVRVCEKTAVLHSLHRVHFLCLLPAFLRGCPHLLFGPGEMLCPGARCHVRFSGRWCRDGRHATTGTWARSCRCGGSRPGRLRRSRWLSPWRVVRIRHRRAQCLRRLLRRQP